MIFMNRQLIVFELAGDYYGVSITAVDCIIKIQRVIKIPYAPAFVEGVTDLRGEVLPVIDLRKRFGLHYQSATKTTRVIVVEMAQHRMGIVVDAVIGVLLVPEGDIESVPAIAKTIRSKFIEGIAKIRVSKHPAFVDGQLVILMNLVEVLSSEEVEDLEIFEENLASLSDGGDHQILELENQGIKNHGG